MNRIVLTILAISCLSSAMFPMGLTSKIEPVKADSAPTVDEWSMFRHDLQHSGYSTSTAPNTNNIIWNASAFTGLSVESSPAVADSKVYVGSNDGNVYCFNASNGTKIWNYSTGIWGILISSSPAVAYGRLYIGAICFGFEYNVTIVAYCNTEGKNVSVPIIMDGVATNHNTTYTFLNLAGVHNFTVPANDAMGHPFIRWSTGKTNTTITVTSDGTYIVYYGTGENPYIIIATIIIIVVAVLSVAIYIKRRLHRT